MQLVNLIFFYKVVFLAVVNLLYYCSGSEAAGAWP
jgi:hypothetical protein